MIRSVVKSFKVPDVEVAAARMSNESALTRMTDSTPKKPWSDLTLVLDGASAGHVEETPGRASLEKLGCRTPPQLHAGGVGPQQQHSSPTRLKKH